MAHPKATQCSNRSLRPYYVFLAISSIDVRSSPESKGGLFHLDHSLFLCHRRMRLEKVAFSRKASSRVEAQVMYVKEYSVADSRNATVDSSELPYSSIDMVCAWEKALWRVDVLPRCTEPNFDGTA